jgi:hypothetical protein
LVLERAVVDAMIRDVTTDDEVVEEELWASALLETSSDVLELERLLEVSTRLEIDAATGVEVVIVEGVGVGNGDGTRIRIAQVKPDEGVFGYLAGWM